MQAMDDMALLQEYVARNSEAAFGELVSRRVGFVYSAALRQVRDPHLAKEITQAVFIILAQKAGRISDKTILAGWLFKTTRYVALTQMRADAKRQRQEKEFQMQTEFQSTTTDEIWNQMSPLLDEALAALGEKDRQAVLLRFFENKSLAEVGSHLGTGEDTARKRVSRALEKLHRYFNRRGVSSTMAIIAGAISANSVQAVPVALAKSVTAMAIAKGAAASGSTLTLIKGALKLMARTKVKTAIVVGMGVLLAAGTTTMTVKEIQEHSFDDSWRTPNLDPRKLDQVSPQVRIVPTKKFPHSGWARNNQMKVMGIGESLTEILGVAYGFWSPARIIISTIVPGTKYDFIANLPVGNAEALQQQIKRKFGLIGGIETRETNVLLLKVKYPNAQGVKQSVDQRVSTRSGAGEYIFTDQPLSNFAGSLEYRFQIPVIDQTGLTNYFDFDLKWNQPVGQPLDFANFKQALTDQLGLELVPSREPIKMLVVEKAQ